MTRLLQIGEPAPPFSLLNQEGKQKANADYAGKWLVLYFYPKDNTPGCTTEAINFTELKRKFSSRQAAIVGISPDSVASHQKFIEKKNLKIELLSDTEKKAAQAFGVWQLKKMAGREYMGVVRSTFLISPEGDIVQIWNSVKVKGHAETVLNELCNL
ncbi:MAG: thioredoxin-dependent thiol peroxidase [Deltaproteobacteria bacterium]|nr:thioredoxin-dependent thiol peroxidase [Deltaproteobacteria bacterium]MBN2673580.1 thioredoxin-dependent thiol peroxidase [Deltaproteobacteria bacterium]